MDLGGHKHLVRNILHIVVKKMGSGVIVSESH